MFLSLKGCINLFQYWYLQLPYTFKECQLYSDPTNLLLETLLLLRDVVQELANDSAAAACVLEVRSILFFSMQYGDFVWFLPLDKHVTLIASIIAPIAANNPQSKEVYLSLSTLQLSLLDSLIQRYISTHTQIHTHTHAHTHTHTHKALYPTQPPTNHTSTPSHAFIPKRHQPRITLIL